MTRKKKHIPKVVHCELVPDFCTAEQLKEQLDYLINRYGITNVHLETSVDYTMYDLDSDGYADAIVQFVCKE